MDLKSGYPFFLIKNGLPYQYPKLTGNIQTDTVVLGGGISGALCAWELTRAGIPCVVVDARTIGLGSTCASTSLLQYELDKPLHQLSALIGKVAAERVYILCGEAIDALEKISAAVNCGTFEKKTSLYYAAYKKDVQLLQREYTDRKAAGFKLDYLHQADVRSRYGFDAPAALLSEKGASLDSYLFTHKVHQHNIGKGNPVYDRTRISGINYHKKGLTLITEDGLSMRAAKLINASGYEIEHFLSKKIVRLHATYAFSSENIPGAGDLWENDTLIWNTADPYLYLRTTSDRRIIAGGRDEPFYNPVLRDKLLKRKTKQLVADTHKLFPQLTIVPEFSWTGTFGTTHDALPFIGKYRNFPHTYFALGFGGNGITFSAIAAQLIREHIMGLRNKDLDLFSFERI